MFAALVLAITLLLLSLLSSSVGALPYIIIDQCSTLKNLTWTAPAVACACLESLPFDEKIRTNLVTVFGKTIKGFHASTSYQILAPPPFQDDVHVDLEAELARMASQSYASYLRFHVDLGHTVLRARDGHLSYTNPCFDNVFISFHPFPLVVANSPSQPDGAIYIAPHAYEFTSAEFGGELAFWEAQPGLANISSFDGARVLAIDGNDPWDAVNKNADIQGGFQSQATRQNGFFASYLLSQTGWTFSMGDFAQRSLPLVDAVTLTVLKAGATIPETVLVPFRARRSGWVLPFDDATVFFNKHCLAYPDYPDTNGRDLNVARAADTPVSLLSSPKEAAFFAPASMAVVVDKPTDMALPRSLLPGEAMNSTGAMQFHLLDNVTGVLALGSFHGEFNMMQPAMLQGLHQLKAAGATKLIVDLTNNNGGLICNGQWLHRILVGPNANSFPQPGLKAVSRAPPLARMLLGNISDEPWPTDAAKMNPLRDVMTFANGTPVPSDVNWMDPVMPTTINGRQDTFSAPAWDQCLFNATAPDEQLFAPEDIVLISNGRCASTCCQFSVLMSVHYGVRSVVLGGKPGAPQNYCGTVGGTTRTFFDIDTALKSAGLKNDAAAPPDLLTAAVIGVSWRLALSIRNPEEPEEWQDHPANSTIVPTLDLVNNPKAIWTAIRARYLQ